MVVNKVRVSVKLSSAASFITYVNPFSELLHDELVHALERRVVIFIWHEKQPIFVPSKMRSRSSFLGVEEPLQEKGHLIVLRVHSLKGCKESNKVLQTPKELPSRRLLRL